MLLYAVLASGFAHILHKSLLTYSSVLPLEFMLQTLRLQRWLGEGVSNESFKSKDKDSKEDGNGMPLT